MAAHIEGKEGLTARKRAPRAPSFPLKSALERVGKLYDAEGRHAVSVDVAAQDLGYKDGSNGAAKVLLATLKQFGLITRPTDGQVAVAKEVEDYKFTPDATQQQAMLARWVSNPPVYAQLLTKFTDHLPSDAALRYEFIQLGFPPQAAEEQVSLFKDSLEFSGYFKFRNSNGQEDATKATVEPLKTSTIQAPSTVPIKQSPNEDLPADDFDRIPVRLSGGRRAILMVPVPFYEADKERLKKQIDLVLADDPPGAPLTTSATTSSESPKGVSEEQDENDLV